MLRTLQWVTTATWKHISSLVPAEARQWAQVDHLPVQLVSGSGKGQNTKHRIKSLLFGWARSSGPIKAKGYRDKVHGLLGGQGPMRRC